MTVFDELAETDGDNKFKAWLSKQEIVAFVSSRRQGKPAGEFDGYLKGSFNLSLVVTFSNRGPKAVIRFPKPGRTATAFRDEKGTTKDSPQHLSPFIIMDYVDGISLATILKQPTETEQDKVILATDTKLDYVYEQLANYMLQLSRLDFSTIRAISKILNYPISRYPTALFTSARAFLHPLANKYLLYLRTQRNIANNREDAKKRFIARHRFKQLISRYCLDNTGSFKLYCNDLQPLNMLVHPDTLRITAVLDFEFTNTMLA
ncbi:hypothetical protein BU26DRAFT_527563 [Trematosphaeria pertusa]|uniref:Aminoglycoside phosphotransferase domain-containing protein n=1 Tax=Trematosphaeria pertusa TaxID=390896 RepID=A0A6A6IV64_9PLEO|nr:uncharacterized protein BU26DRAFT_527563 [Trematosphaeria pertusa]KAF2254455.1 hypothetical protein BU26DRAFT_527563 [Trematosphaeria pertusa]